MPDLAPRFTPGKAIKKVSVRRRQGKRWLSTSSKEWKAHRAEQLAKEPLCRHCKEKDLIVAANEVDHINGRADRESDYVDSNYQSLCKPCHSRKTRSEQ